MISLKCTQLCTRNVRPFQFVTNRQQVIINYFIKFCFISETRNKQINKNV